MLVFGADYFFSINDERAIRPFLNKMSVGNIPPQEVLEHKEFLSCFDEFLATTASILELPGHHSLKKFSEFITVATEHKFTYVLPDMIVMEPGTCVAYRLVLKVLNDLLGESYRENLPWEIGQDLQHYSICTNKQDSRPLYDEKNPPPEEAEEPFEISLNKIDYKMLMQLQTDKIATVHPYHKPMPPEYIPYASDAVIER